MKEINVERLRAILSKDMDEKSFTEAMKKIEENFQFALDIAQNQEEKEPEKSIKILLLLGLGRDRTISYLSEYKVNRGQIKASRESMNDEQTNIRLKNEKIVTNFKIESTKRAKRFKHFEESNIKWEDIAERYLNGEALHKIAKEHSLKINYVTEQLKEDGIHDESRSTILKNKKAVKLEEVIDDDYIVQLVKENPLDSKDLWWEKAKEKYPWLLRKQMFEKLIQLGLERTVEEVNQIKSIKGKGKFLLNKNNSNKNNLDIEVVKKVVEEMKEKDSGTIRKKIRNLFKTSSVKEIDEVLVKLGVIEDIIVSPQEINAITKEEIERTFGSVENLVEAYMQGVLGNHSKIATIVNIGNQTGIEVSARQIEKAITRHPSYESRSSLPETQLFEFTKETFPNFTVVREKQIPGTMKRMDVYIEELKVGLELNGDYYHSDEVILANYGRKSFDHHKERVEDAAKHGITLVYVWERDWNLNYDEVEKAILNKDWKNPILNKYSNSDYHRKVIAPGTNKKDSE